MADQNQKVDVPEPLVPKPYDTRPAVDPQVAADKLFEMLAEYIALESEDANADLDVLQKLNDAALEKYQSMLGFAKTLETSSADMHARFRELLPYFSKIDEVERATAELEKAVFVLDDYSRNLERKFVQLFSSIYRSDRALGVSATGTPGSSSAASPGQASGTSTPPVQSTTSDNNLPKSS
jgi:hypothetical protein